MGLIAVYKVYVEITVITTEYAMKACANADQVTQEKTAVNIFVSITAQVMEFVRTGSVSVMLSMRGLTAA